MLKPKLRKKMGSDEVVLKILVEVLLHPDRFMILNHLILYFLSSGEDTAGGLTRLISFYETLTVYNFYICDYYEILGVPNVLRRRRKAYRNLACKHPDVDKSSVWSAAQEINEAYQVLILKKETYDRFVRALLSGRRGWELGPLLTVFYFSEVPLILRSNSPILLIFSNLSSVFAILESHRKERPQLRLDVVYGR